MPSNHERHLPSRPDTRHRLRLVRLLIALLAAVAAIAAIRRETGSGARAAVICLSQCCIAWLAAFAVFSVLRALA